MHTDLKKHLERVARRRRLFDLWLSLALAWALCAAFGLLIWLAQRQSGWTTSLAFPAVAAVSLAAFCFVFIRFARTPTDVHAIASRIEAAHPELQGRLVTALQQKPGSGGDYNYLQQRLLDETLELRKRADWQDIVPLRRLRLAQVGQWSALGVLIVMLAHLYHGRGHQLLSRSTARGVTVTPGDVALERGSSLVVLARFTGPLPPQVQIEYGLAPALKRQPLIKSLGDPIFGGSIAEVDSNFTYRVAYGNQVTPEFKVTVYEHPRLERADADLSFPSYTALPAKRIENTRRLSAVEGSLVDYSFEFNKPVASAKLVSRDKSHSVITLSAETNQPKAILKQFPLQASHAYDLQLVDFDGRTNKVPAEFVFDVLKNRTPELRLTTPRGDVRPSPLEELTFEGTVWDDFGVQAFGIGYAVNGVNPKFIELGRSVPGNEKHPFKHLLRLEDLRVQPDELLSWFVWADDLGPDGKSRRTMGDLYFGEVRPFEEVFREAQGMEGQPGAGSGNEDRTGKLTELEKQIVNATWKLERDRGGASNSPALKSTGSGDQSWHQPFRHLPQWVSRTRFLALSVAGQVRPEGESSISTGSGSGNGNAPSYQDDAGVVLGSQLQALQQAKEALQNQHDPQTAGLWQKAVNEMQSALTRLEQATNSPAALKEALASEQAAYQALIRLQAHEYQVSRSRSRSSSGSAREQQLQRQLQDMDLTQSENRYENQREAERNQNPQRKEQLQMLSRLQELARRQQDLNQRLKELQTALQEAKTEEERAELRRQLKRLQEEEQQMLSDVDEMRQRMDRSENQSQMADEKRQLDQTRQEVQKASEAAGKGAAAQALAAGTRAQEQLQQLRDDLRKKSSSEFAEDLRQMRGQARQLAWQQEEILKKIQEGSSTERKTLASGSDQDENRAALERQKQLMTNVLDRATQVSQQADQSEPLLSRQLYDTIRKFSQDGAKDVKETENDLMNHGPMTRSLMETLRDDSRQGTAKMEDLTSEMLKLGYLPQAARLGQKAQSELDALSKGIERAANSVLGDDTEDLRLAQRQLDELTGQLQREMAANQPTGSETNGAGSTSPNGSQSREPRNPNGDTNELAQAGSPSNKSSKNGQQPGRNGEPKDTGQGEASGQSPGSGNEQQQASNQKAADQNNQQQAAGQQPGQQPGQPGASDGSQGEGTQPGTAPQPGRGKGQPGRPGQAPVTAGGAAAGGDPAESGELAAPARGQNLDFDRLLNQAQPGQTAPLTGGDFNSWSDRLREVEELVDAPDLRDNVAKARERARLVRQDYKRDRKKPDWAVVQLQVMKPLVEVRNRIAEELARRESREALVPLDRDPVPNRYSELVRRYYEELGKDKPAPKQ